MIGYPTPWRVQTVGKLSYILDARRETICCLMASEETATRIVEAVNDGRARVGRMLDEFFAAEPPLPQRRLAAKIGTTQCGMLVDDADAPKPADGRAHNPTPTPAGERLLREPAASAFPADLCEICGWSLGTGLGQCRPGDCSMRPRPSPTYSEKREARQRATAEASDKEESAWLAYSHEHRQRRGWLGDSMRQVFGHGFRAGRQHERERAERAEAERKSARARVEELESERDDISERLGEAREERDEAEGKLNAIRRAIDELRTAHERAERELEEARRKVGELEAELDTAFSRGHAAGARRADEAEAQLEKTERELEEARTDSAAKDARIAELEAARRR